MAAIKIKFRVSRNNLSILQAFLWRISLCLYPHPHPHEDHSAHHVYPSQHGVCEQFLIPPGNACVPIVAEYS